MEEKGLDCVRLVLDDACVDSVNGVLTIRSDELEKWISHFSELGRSFMENGCPTWQSWFYWGKRELLVDLFNHIKSVNQL